MLQPGVTTHVLGEAAFANAEYKTGVPNDSVMFLTHLVDRIVVDDGTYCLNEAVINDVVDDVSCSCS